MKRRITMSLATAMFVLALFMPEGGSGITPPVLRYRCVKRNGVVVCIKVATVRR